MIIPGTAFYAIKHTHLSGHHITDHSHENAQLTIGVSGTVRVQTDYGWWLALPGTGIFIAPNVVHRAAYPQKVELINILFNYDSDAPPLRHTGMFTVSPLLLELAREACILCSADMDNPELMLLKKLIICQLDKKVPQANTFIPEGRDKRLRFITNKLRTYPCCTETLCELAEQACASERTIARLFINETGMSFVSWRERLRTVTAIEKMIAGESVLATALDLGYQSASSFTTAFTRIVGLPPRKYINNYLHPKF